MADRSIDELTAAEDIRPTDLFVLQQEDEARKLQGQVLINWLIKSAEGHGGIREIRLKSSTDAESVYEIVFSDASTFQYTVKNGRTPARGTDYWTANDVSEIEKYCKDYIDTEILGGES